MNLLELSKLLLDEKLAEEYLLENGILKTFTNCEKCGSTKLGRIRRGKYRCYGCKAEWSIRKNSFLISHQISFSKFLGVIECFTLDLTAKQVSEELLLEKKGVQRIYTLLRKAIIGEKLIEYKSKTLKDKSPIFSITITNKKVSINLDPSDESQNLFKLKRTRVPSRETTFQFHHSKVNSMNIRRRIKTFPIEQHYFWRYANVKLQQFRGTKLKYLFLYLKEIEFRYNNPENLFDKIVEKLAVFDGWSYMTLFGKTKNKSKNR